MELCVTRSSPLDVGVRYIESLELLELYLNSSSILKDESLDSMFDNCSDDDEVQDSSSE